MPTLPIPQLFERLGGLLTAPLTSLEAATEGRWNGLRDGLLLLLVGALVVYTPDFARAVVVGYDLGAREGVFELSWAAQRAVGTDVLILLGMVTCLVAILRITQRLTFERSLSLATVCWMPLFLTRLAGHSLRHYLEAPPAIFPEAPEWIIGLVWSGLLVILAFVQLFGSHGASHD